MKKLLISSIAVLFVSMFSCSSDDDNEKIDDKGVALTSIKGTSAIDLSDRKDWILKVNFGYVYNFTTDGSSFDASPKDGSNTYHFKSIYSSGDNLAYGRGPSLMLESPNYYKPNVSRSDSPIMPNINDQTTLDKLNLADRLVCNYSGVVSDSINVKLQHADALLMFETVNFPNDGDFSIASYSMYGRILPYKEDDKYKAIVIASYGEFSTYIYVKNGNAEQEVFSIPFEDDSNPSVMRKFLRPNSIYKFKLVYDETTKKTSLTDYEVSPWSE